MEYTPNTPEQNAEYFESQDHKTWQKLAGLNDYSPDGIQETEPHYAE